MPVPAGPRRGRKPPPRRRSARRAQTPRRWASIPLLPRSRPIPTPPQEPVRRARPERALPMGRAARPAPQSRGPARRRRRRSEDGGKSGANGKRGQRRKRTSRRFCARRVKAAQIHGLLFAASGRRAQRRRKKVMDRSDKTFKNIEEGEAKSETNGVDDATGGTGGGGGIGTPRRLAGFAGGRWRNDALWRRRCAGRRALRGRPRADLRPDRPQRRWQDFALQLHFTAL